ncbi:patatin-like phospholipase family protein [uncultured Cyclobacterium sp.]|uniref:patatin-like phospholipase family protein n=1 Tax=uncultured Cyclobacterium sp. TaxID=453820 RepID=UPI0030EF5A25
MEHTNKLGVALSGGGVRGIAHLGILQGLNEEGIYPDCLSGSSAGAIVAAMYAHGYQPKEIFDIIVQTKYFKFFKPSISFKALLRMDLLADLFAKYLPEDDFSALEIPIYVVATNFQKNRTEFFSKGPLIKRLMASSCIPGMFEPILTDGDLYIDGGVLNNLPVEPLVNTCDAIIGINCNNLPELKVGPNIKGLIERSVIMALNYNVYSRKDKCDYFIDPPGLAQFGVLEIKRAAEIYNTGYQYCKEFLLQNPSMSRLKGRGINSLSKS